MELLILKIKKQGSEKARICHDPLVVMAKLTREALLSEGEKGGMTPITLHG